MKKLSLGLALVILMLLTLTTLSTAETMTDSLTFTRASGTRSNVFTVQPPANIKDTKASRNPVPARSKELVGLNFDRLPDPSWETWDCGDGVSQAMVSHGILTIDSPSSCYEFILWYPNGTWHKLVDNARGWVIEASLKVDPSTEPRCDDRGSVQIWANDHTNLVIIGFSTNEICIAYPDNVRFPMDTTNSFHIYRIESKGNRVQVYVDGDLRIDHTLSWTGGGSNILNFGDGVGGTTSRSYWDYFSYNVFP